MIIDISPEITEDIAVFPGDKKFSRHISMDFDQGHHLALSSIETTVHLGAHTDAPNHYNAGTVGISERSLDYYYGECQVIAVDIPRGERIYPKDIDLNSITAKRILFCSNSFPDPNHWNDDFNSLSPELIEALHQKGVILVGIDTPSVDPADSKTLEAHTKIAECDIAILEGIVLTKVDPGNYTLIALPLKIKAADASPVRAVLVQQ